MASLKGNADIGKRVSQIDVADAHNAHVTLAGDTAVLYLGEDQFLPRIESYLQLADTLRQSVPDIEYVDLRFGERVFVGPMGKGRRAPVSMPATRAGNQPRSADQSHGGGR